MTSALVQHAVRVYLSTRIWTAKDVELMDEVLRMLEVQLGALTEAIGTDPEGPRWAVAQRCLALLALLRDGATDGGDPELQSKLRGLYGWTGRRVVEAAVRRDPRGLASPQRVVAELRRAAGFIRQAPCEPDEEALRS
jgi:hypothetical protein